MDHLRIKENECGYQDKDRRIEEQFINDINDDGVMTKIITELTTMIETIEITSKRVS